MFYGCSSLCSVSAYFTTAPGTTYTENWLYGVYPDGDFYATNYRQEWSIDILPPLK